jgi:hypothetical protein
MAERGVTLEEVASTLEHGSGEGVRGNRTLREQVLKAGYSWRGRRYPHKRIVAVYTEEDDEPVVLTVIAQYGRWG